MLCLCILLFYTVYKRWKIYLFH